MPNALFGYGQPGYGIPNYSGLQNASLLGGYSSRAALDTPHVAGTPWDVILSNGQAQSVPDLGGGLHFYGPVSHDGPIATSDPEVMAHKDRQFSTGMNQAAIKIAALIGGGTLLSNALGPLSSGSATGYGSGVASASDAAYGSAAAGGESVAGSLTAGADTLAAAPHGIGGLLSSLGSSGGSMGLTDWLNIGNTILGAYGANRAADTQAGDSGDAIAELRRQYDTTRADNAPYQAAGVAALGQLSDPNANFQASPDYAFRRSEGQRDIGNSFAARGGAFSGNALRALDQYNSSLASGEFGNWWNRQAGLAGVGQTANAQTGAYGQNTANGIANQVSNAGDARASGIAGMYGAVNNGLSNYLYGRRGQSPYVGYGG